MPYKYFSEGLQGGAGADDVTMQGKVDADLEDEFRYPLLADTTRASDEPIVPDRAFTVVKINDRKIRSADDAHRFRKLLSDVPKTLDVIFDITNVVSLGSDAIAALLHASKSMKSQGQNAYIITTQSNVLEKIANLHLESQFNIRNSSREAFEEIYALAA